MGPQIVEAHVHVALTLYKTPSPIQDWVKPCGPPPRACFKPFYP